MTAKMPDKINLSLKKRFKRYGTSNIDFTVTLKSVFEKYGGVCQNCGIDTKHIHPPQSNSASVEHITPLSRGGSHSWDNVELLCYECNTKRNQEKHKKDKPTIHVAKFKIFGYTVNITRGN